MVMSLPVPIGTNYIAHCKAYLDQLGSAVCESHRVC